MKIIIEYGFGDEILQVRAAKIAIQNGIKDIYGISFEDGSFFSVKKNKGSVRVYR